MARVCANAGAYPSYIPATGNRHHCRVFFPFKHVLVDASFGRALTITALGLILGTSAYRESLDHPSQRFTYSSTCYPPSRLLPWGLI